MSGDSSIEVLGTESAVLEQQNFWVDPLCLEVIREMERFTGESPSDFVDKAVRENIRFILEHIDDGFPKYVRETAEKLGIDDLYVCLGNLR